MKLAVQGIEEIEITDPAGLCNPPAPMPAMLPPPRRNPMPPNLPPAVNPFQPQPQPQVPTPFGDPYINPGHPGIGPATYTRHNDGNIQHDGTKWGVGGDAIQRAGEQVQPVELTERSKRIMRGEDPDGD